MNPAGAASPTPHQSKVHFYSFRGTIHPLECESAVGQASPSAVITLVHGTFAKNAPWVRPDSVICTSWPDSNDCATMFSVFDWSGGNSHEARTQARTDFVNHMRELTAEYPDAPHLVIAHSHGGNIALRALGDEHLKGKVRGLICLNTPFLHCQPRSLLPLLLLLVAINPIALLMMSAVPFFQFYMLPRFPGEFFRPVLSVSLLMFAALVPVTLAGTWIWILCEKFVTRVENYQTRRSEALRLQADPGCPVLASTVKQDEAYYWLALLDKLTYWTTFSTWSGCGLSGAGLVIWLLSGSGGFLTDFNWFPKLTRAAMAMSHFGLSMIVSGLIVVILSWVILGTVCALLRRHKFAYGERIWDSLLLRITVQPTPAKEVPVEFRYFSTIVGGLKHSALYQSPEVIKELAQWFSKLPDRRAEASNTMGTEPRMHEPEA